ncbi:hypothetical protein HYFRA_00003447 [Hymenoscyphus fraxineus]|uniref:Uncharacterized protein n=1 Tax=Hymenoscyphus fraxineus TaxID=746836 RepID=A0A9N9KTM1_9HELO|nr:hypothetical protein HYFRA_00003447 [Hymenoscyphus fraxineus]
MTMLLKAAVIIFSAPLVYGYTTFITECTKPNATVNYVSSSSTRGTLDILWSCLFTIFACTWTVLHLNVPEQRDGRDPGWRGNIKWSVKGFLIKFRWMLITVVAPEIVLAKNIADLSDAKKGVRKLEEFANEDGVAWSETHDLFANMGGFVIKSNILNGNGNINQESRNSPDRQQRKAIHALRSHDIFLLRKNGHLNDNKLPNLSIEEILDKSKSDTVVRFLAVVQILWMVVQIILRREKRLATSQLEVTVLAFAVLAVAIYIANWKKPQDVRTPITILSYEGDPPKAVMDAINKDESDPFLDEIMMSFEYSQEDSSHRFRIPNTYTGTQHSARNVDNIPMLSNVCFGAVHLVAWNFSFPTPAERLLWRAASIYLTGGIFLLLGSLVIFGMANDKAEDMGCDKISEWLVLMFVPFMLLCVVLYVLCRLFIIVEMLRCLFFLPPSAYIVTWATNIPHVA